MPILIQCPSCERRLRVPDNLLGKQVKCPSCQTTFTAAEGGEAEGPGTAPTEEGRPVTARRRPAPPPPDDDEGNDEERPSRSQRRRPPEDWDEEEGYEEEDDYEEETRPRRRRRRRARTAEAKATVTPPAIALLVAGILGLLLWIANFTTLAVNPNAGAELFGGPRAGAPRDPGFRAGQLTARRSSASGRSWSSPGRSR
jgi:predicted Zn finger-like uncharacterized protein